MTTMATTMASDNDDNKVYGDDAMGDDDGAGVAAMNKSEAAGPKSDATIKSRQWWQRVATKVIGVQWRRWMMVLEGVGDVRWRSTETAMIWRGGSETAKIELKQQMAEGGWPKEDG